MTKSKQGDRKRLAKIRRRDEGIMDVITQRYLKSKQYKKGYAYLSS